MDEAQFTVATTSLAQRRNKRGDIVGFDEGLLRRKCGEGPWKGWGPE